MYIHVLACEWCNVALMVTGFPMLHYELPILLHLTVWLDNVVEDILHPEQAQAQVQSEVPEEQHYDTGT